jgi:hypothetical protein
VALCQARISTKPLWGFSSSNPYHSQSRAEQCIFVEHFVSFRVNLFFSCIQTIVHTIKESLHVANFKCTPPPLNRTSVSKFFCKYYVTFQALKVHCEARKEGGGSKQVSIKPSRFFTKSLIFIRSV